jgi:hypothetical protein
MAKKPTKNFGGRPVQREPEPGKRTHLSVAVPLPLKQRLEQEAAKRGWSVSNEVVWRLEQSFEPLRPANLKQIIKDEIVTVLGQYPVRERDK